MLAVSTIAYAGLIYSGPLASGLQIGIPALLAGSALGLIVIAIRTGKPGIFGAPYGALAVIYALLPGRLGFGQHALTDPVAATDTVMMVCAFVSLFTGLVFWLLGRFRIAEFARFLPYPVVAGYIAAVGWLFIVGGLGVGTALHPAGLMVRDFIAGEISLRLLAPAAFGIIAIILARWLRHWTIVPGMLAISIAGFHANRLVQGLTIDQAVASGWLLGPFKPGPISVRLPWDTIGNLNFDVLNAIAPVVLTIVLVGSITTIMSNAGLEERLDMMLDGDREMETAGIATLVSGFLGGIVVAQHIPSTVLARRIGGHGRLAAVVAGLCCGCTLLAGPSALSLLPRFAIGGLLIFNGLDLLIDRVWATRRGLSAVEWGAVLLVLLTAMIAGFINAIVVGLALALVIFVLSYRRVPVIALSTSGAIHHSPTQRRPAAEAALRDLGDSIRIIRLQGYLFFLNTERLLREMPAGGVRYLILDFRAVSNIDSSAVATLRRAYHIARERNYTVNCTDLNESVRAQFALQQLRTASAAGFASSMTEAEVLLGGVEDELLGTLPGHVGGDRQVSLSDLMREVLGRDIPDEVQISALDTRRFATGDVLVREGDPANMIVFIRSGCVAVEVEGPSGVPIPIAVAEPGVVIGELSFYTGNPCSATVRASTDTEGVLITREALDRMATAAPELAMCFREFMIRLLARRLVRNMQHQVRTGR